MKKKTNPNILGHACSRRSQLSITPKWRLRIRQLKHNWKQTGQCQIIIRPHRLESAPKPLIVKPSARSKVERALSCSVKTRRDHPLQSKHRVWLESIYR